MKKSYNSYGVSGEYTDYYYQAPKETNTIANGTILCNGKYKVIAPLGSGGFGTTVKALHYIGETVLGVVVLKFPIEKNTNHLKFLEEAIAIRKINHPNLVKLYDVFIEDEVPYLVMEYIEGKTLHSLIRTNNDDYLSPERIFHIMAQLGEAVSNLHDKGVLHCDLHPRNIIVMPWLDINYRPDFVKIIDFGLAALWRKNAWKNSYQGMGMIGFAAPEQLYDKPSPTSDLFSLGVIMHVLLTGYLPYNYELIYDKENWLNTSPPPMPNDIPPEIANFVRRCIEPKEEKRYGGLPGFVRQCIEFRQLCATKYDQPTEEHNVKSLLKLAKDTFLNAGLSTNDEARIKLYARAAELFEELKKMNALPKSMEKFAKKAKKYGHVVEKYDQPTEENDVKSLLQLAKDTFMDASLANNETERVKLYARAAELFEELEKMNALPKSVEKFAEKAKQYGKIVENTNSFQDFVNNRKNETNSFEDFIKQNHNLGK